MEPDRKQSFKDLQPLGGSCEKTIYAIDQCLSEIKDIRKLGPTDRQDQMMSALEAQLMAARSQMFHELMKDLDDA